MLKYGGICSNAHCVTFPQDVNESAQIFSRLPTLIHIYILKSKKTGVLKSHQKETQENAPHSNAQGLAPLQTDINVETIKHMQVYFYLMCRIT